MRPFLIHPVHHLLEVLVGLGPIVEVGNASLDPLAAQPDEFTHFFSPSAMTSRATSSSNESHSLQCPLEDVL